MSRSHNENRIFGLDLLRCVAILLVLYYHSRYLLSGFFSFRPFANLVAFSDVSGIYGVEIFFALSGFLIGRILIKDFLSTGYQFRNIANFWLKRWFRTLPLYYFILAITFLVWRYYFGTTFDIRYLFFAQNLYNDRPDFLAESWSLSIEEWSYLLIPVFLFLCSIVAAKNHKNLLRFLLSYLLFSLLMKLYFVKSLSIPIYDIGSLRTLVVFRLDAIMYGVIAAYCYQYTQLYAKYYKPIFALSLLTLVGNFALIRISYAPFNFNSIGIYSYYINYFSLSVTNISAALLVPCLAIKKFDTVSTYIKRLVSFIAKISYSIYLTHYSLIFKPFFDKITPGTMIESVLYFGGYIAIVIIISTLTYHFIEKTFLRFRDPFIYKLKMRFS